MSGEIIRVIGTSGWVQVGAGLSLTAGTFVQASASTIATLLAAVEQDYPEFEARLQITAGTPTENNTVDIHLRMGDGTNQQPAPSGSFAPHFVGAITLDNQTGYYFEDGLQILNNDSEIYLKSNEASTTLTATLHIRAKSLNSAA